MYWLFYSKYCKYSEKLCEMLPKIGENTNFNYICVDKKNGKRHEFVKKHNITEVPTLIIDGKYHTGQDAFKWVKDKIKNLNHQVSSQNTRINKNYITGFTPENYSMNLYKNEEFDGNSAYCSLNYSQPIKTISEDEEIEKPENQFILPEDNLIGNNKEEIRVNKKDLLNGKFEELKSQREKEDKIISNMNRYA